MRVNLKPTSCLTKWKIKCMEQCTHSTCIIIYSLCILRKAILFFFIFFKIWRLKIISRKKNIQWYRLISVKKYFQEIRKLTSYQARIPLIFQEAIFSVNLRPSSVFASELTSVGKEVSVPSGRLSIVSSFLGGAFFPLPPLPFCKYN